MKKIDVRKIDMYGRDFSKFSPSDFRDDVSIQPWHHDSNDPNFLMNDFIWRLDGCSERHAPTKKLTPKEVKLKLKPWITPETLKLIKIRDKLFKRKKRQPENELVKETYNRVRNIVNRELKKSKTEYHKSFLKPKRLISKKTWEGIRKIV